jgi:hypothetical protein
VSCSRARTPQLLGVPSLLLERVRPLLRLAEDLLGLGRGRLNACFRLALVLGLQFCALALAVGSKA